MPQADIFERELKRRQPARYLPKDDAWETRLLPAGLKILVVDDSRELCGVLKQILEEFDCEVRTASSGEEAIALAVADAPDLIVMDFELPDMNGYELIRSIRQREELLSIPMIMLTGSPRVQGLAESLGLELAELLHKPTTRLDILKACCRALGGQLPRAKDNGASAPARMSDDRLIGAPDEVAKLNGIIGSAGAASLFVTEPTKEDDATIDAVELSDTAPIIKLVNATLEVAVQKKASDIHIEPQEKGVRVRLRIDGALVSQYDVPLSMAPAIAARIKVMCGLDISERRVPQDGRFQIRLGGGGKMEARVSTLPSKYGEKIVMRLLGQSKIYPDLRGLKMSPRDHQCLETAISNPNGLILVTGPTGSGKTTTLYTLISLLNTMDRNVVTAEDPIEYELPGITQVAIRAAIGLTFEKALRAFLRQDPDVILVGEIRDAETANIALKAAATGHLVLSTLHTNDAPSTISRLVNMGAPAYMVAASVRVVVAQRLVRVLCPHCKKPGTLSEAERRHLSAEEILRLQSIRVPAGCPQCDGLGYRGRTSIMEVLPIQTLAMRELITQGAPPDSLRTLALTEGLRPLRVGALDLVARGETSISEAFKILVAE